MRAVLYIGLAALLVLIVCLLAFNRTAEAPVTREPAQGMENEEPIAIELADSPEEWVRGLSGREEIADNYGLLFVFPRPERQGFWMKDMNFSIDIIWLSDTGTIVGIEDSASPDSYPERVFYSPQPVRYVLETRAGFARDRGWSVGTQVPIDLP